MTEIILASLVIFAAYFLKGFTGFGPALVIIPFFTLLFDPGTAINTAAIFDFIIGGILLFSVRKDIKWKFVFSLFTALAIGAVFGSLLLGKMPDYWLKKIIGIAIIIFAMIILFHKNGRLINPKQNKIQLAKYPVGFLGGFLGGFIGISGPPIIIYMKMLFDKTFFRTQLIGLFFWGTGWRFMLYQLNDVSLNISLYYLAVFFVVMLVAAWLGTHFHLKVNETVFNKIVVVLLLVPAIKLLM